MKMKKERKCQMGGGDVYKEWKLLLKGKKSGGGQGRCERRSEAFVKIQIKNYLFIFFLGGGGLGGGGVRVDVN